MGHGKAILDRTVTDLSHARDDREKPHLYIEGIIEMFGRKKRLTDYANCAG